MTAGKSEGEPPPTDAGTARERTDEVTEVVLAVGTLRGRSSDGGGDDAPPTTRGVKGHPHVSGPAGFEPPAERGEEGQQGRAGLSGREAPHGEIR